MNIILRYFFDKGYEEQKTANQKIIKGDRFLFLMVKRDFRFIESRSFQDVVEDFEEKNSCYFSGCTGEMIIFQHNSYK